MWLYLAGLYLVFGLGMSWGAHTMQEHYCDGRAEVEIDNFTIRAITFIWPFFMVIYVREKIRAYQYKRREGK